MLLYHEMFQQKESGLNTFKIIDLTTDVLLKYNISGHHNISGHRHPLESTHSLTFLFPSPTFSELSIRCPFALTPFGQ